MIAEGVARQRQPTPALFRHATKTNGALLLTIYLPFETTFFGPFSEGHFWHVALSTPWIRVVAAELDSMPPQQVAWQAWEAFVQQSHVHCSQLQTPDSQQHTPSAQQLEQTHAFEASVVEALLATLAPIARPTTKRPSNRNTATDFIF